MGIKRSNELTPPGRWEGFIGLDEWILPESQIEEVTLFFFFFFVFSRAAPVAYGGSQARSPIGTAATGPHTPQPQQRGIRAPSATCTTAHGNAGSSTH